MKYFLKTVVVGELYTNCYILVDKNSLEGVVIDPGDEFDKIFNVIQKSKINIKYIINTHAHFDHIGADKELKNKTKADLLIHKEDYNIFKDSLKSLSEFKGINLIVEPDRFLKEGDAINVGELSLKIIHTPGHTPGGISIKCEDIIFCGDSLFKDGIGRTDIPFASYNVLMNSIKNKLLILPEDTKVYPGHGEPTTIGEEKKNNPYLDSWIFIKLVV